jgi:hypothetical protein
MRRDEHFSILGLLPGASPREIRRAFRRLVLDLHPDRRGGDARSAARLRGVVDAYEALIGPPRAARIRRPKRPQPVVVAKGPMVCPRCDDSYGEAGECPRCGIAVQALGTVQPAPVEPAVEAMVAALESARPSRFLWLAPRVPAAAISGLLMSGALALSVHGPVATMLVGYGLLLLVGESVARPAS